MLLTHVIFRAGQGSHFRQSGIGSARGQPSPLYRSSRKYRTATPMASFERPASFRTLEKNSSAGLSYRKLPSPGPPATAIKRTGSDLSLGGGNFTVNVLASIPSLSGTGLMLPRGPTRNTW